EPAGPAFALYTRQPSETVHLRVGIAVSKGRTRAEPIAHGLLVIPPELPAGSMAVRRHIRGSDGLAQARAQLLEAPIEAGHHPGLPFLELYVTEPGAEADPASLRTDLFLTLD